MIVRVGEEIAAHCKKYQCSNVPIRAVQNHKTYTVNDTPYTLGSRLCPNSEVYRLNGPVNAPKAVVKFEELNKNLWTVLPCSKQQSMLTGYWVTNNTFVMWEWGQMRHLVSELPPKIDRTPFAEGMARAVVQMQKELAGYGYFYSDAKAWNLVYRYDGPETIDVRFCDFGGLFRFGDSGVFTIGVPEFNREPHPIVTRAEAPRVAEYLAAAVAYEIMVGDNVEYGPLMYSQTHWHGLEISARFDRHLPTSIAEWGARDPAARDDAGSPLMTMLALALRSRPELCKCCKCGVPSHPGVEGASVSPRCGNIVCGACWMDKQCGCGIAIAGFSEGTVDREAHKARVLAFSGGAEGETVRREWMEHLLQKSEKDIVPDLFTQGIMRIVRHG